MLSKATLQLIRSLDTRKGRREHGLFVAEGPRLVGELLGFLPCETLFYTDSAVHEPLITKAIESNNRTTVTLLSEKDMGRCSLQQSPQGVLALFRIPQFEWNPTEVAVNQLCIALDGVQDPGNLGTIVRLADWFGVTDIVCSQDTCDIWNPKAIQATMGGLARVRVHYINLPAWLQALPATVPVYGTSLQGTSVWTAQVQQCGVIVMGNEGRGVSPAVAALCRQQLLIPNFPLGRPCTESLNVAMATAIVLSEFRRRAGAVSVM